MKKAARESLDAYYREADSWATDQQDALRASRRVAWIVAAVAVAVALFEALALVFLAPLKTVVPYTLMVDRNTGYVQALKPVEPGSIAAEPALTQSFLVQYVIARESFDINELQDSYRKVNLWSAEPTRGDYVSMMQSSNPASPLARYPRSTVVSTRVRSVSQIGGNNALVRFETQRRDAGGQAAPSRFWVAVIHYQYTNGGLSSEDRYLNPLGFQVVRYRRDAESAPTASEAEPPLTTAPALVVPGAVPSGPAPAPAPGAPPQATTPPRPVARSTPEVQL